MTLRLILFVLTATLTVRMDSECLAQFLLLDTTAISMTVKGGQQRKPRAGQPRRRCSHKHRGQQRSQQLSLPLMLVMAMLVTLLATLLPPMLMATPPPWLPSPWLTLLPPWPEFTLESTPP